METQLDISWTVLLHQTKEPYPEKQKQETNISGSHVHLHHAAVSLNVQYKRNANWYFTNKTNLLKRIYKYMFLQLS